MKFYAFNDDGSDKVNLLLDHNTTAKIYWKNKDTDNTGTLGPGTTENVSGPKEVLEQLKTDTSSWVGTITPENYSIDQSGQGSNAKYTIDYSSYKARLITAQEVAQITGNTIFDEKTSSSTFYFDTNTNTASTTCKSGDTSGCKYGWLYDRTNKECTTNGCLNNSDIVTHGYWTISPLASNSKNAWFVFFGGHLGGGFVDDGSLCGVRPVIAVLKSKLT